MATDLHMLKDASERADLDKDVQSSVFIPPADEVPNSFCLQSVPEMVEYEKQLMTNIFRQLCMHTLRTYVGMCASNSTCDSVHYICVRYASVAFVYGAWHACFIPACCVSCKCDFRLAKF